MRVSGALYSQVDYAVRDGLEHKIERNLYGSGSPAKPEESMICWFYAATARLFGACGWQ